MRMVQSLQRQLMCALVSEGATELHIIDRDRVMQNTLLARLVRKFVEK